MFKSAAGFILFCSLSALAAPQKSSSTVVEIFGGFVPTNFDYREDMPPPDKSIETGTFTQFAGGLKISSTQMAGFKSHFLGYFEYGSQVQTTYEGTVLQTGAPAYATDYHNLLRLEANYYFGVHPNVAFHAGYAYRSWKRYLAYGSGYVETYTWSYLPLGVYFHNEIGPFEYGVDLTFLVMMAGQIEIVFSENVTGGNDTTLTLGNKNGYRISFPVSYAIAEQISLQVKPWYEFTEIGQSDRKFNSTPSINSYIYEPSSKTKQMGLYLGLSIRVM